MTTRANPFVAVLWLLTAISAAAGLVMISSNDNPRALDHDPATLTTGHVLLGIAGMSLVGLLVASAICWQMRQRS